MVNKGKLYRYQSTRKLAERLRGDLSDHDFVLLYAFNATGKTRLSMDFKDLGKRKNKGQADTLYFNAYTEDLFRWDNDLKHDRDRKLELTGSSRFFDGMRELALEEKIFAYLNRYADFDFRIDYDEWAVRFSKQDEENIKISRGEENMFVWCMFLALCELAIEGADAYKDVKYLYIDDPISSLDDNNAIAVASDLAQLLKKGKGKVKIAISSHHSLFFNVMCNELKGKETARYFLHRNAGSGYVLQKTNDTPFFHHVALLSELKEAVSKNDIKTYHFNVMRGIMEKTSSFFGFNDFGKCIHGIEDKVLLERALNLLSHGNYSIYDPVEMVDNNKDLFKKIFLGFMDKYHFELPALLAEGNTSNQQP